MKCKFCGAEVTLGKRCEYCGSVAEPFYYGIKPEKKKPEGKKPELAEETEYIVKSGDNLWKIAKQFYGDGKAYTVLASRNKIKNPNLIYPGQVLQI